MNSIEKKSTMLSALNNHRIKSYSLLSATIGLVTDVLQPLAPFAREAFIGSAFVAVVLVLLSFNKQARQYLKNTLAFFIMLGVFAGGIWGAQEYGYDEYGILASIIPPIHEVQKELGIVERLEGIEKNIILVGEDVKDIKTEVTKTLNVNDLIRELDNASTEAEKEKTIILIKKYPFETLLDPYQVIKIISHFQGREKLELTILLAQYMRQTMTSKQFFEAVEPEMELNNYALTSSALRSKLGMKLKFTDYINHVNQIMQISGKESEKQARVLLNLRYLEEVTEQQKKQIAKAINMELKYLELSY